MNFFNDVPNFDDQIEKPFGGETSVVQVFKLLSVSSERDTEMEDLIANDIDDDDVDDDEDVEFDSTLVKELGLSLKHSNGTVHTK